MNSTNSKNMSLIIILLVIVAVTFTYVIITQNLNGTMYSSINQVDD